MYAGDNPTALASMEAIANALMGLLAESGLAEVTVREVCHAADRSRQTFYQLFDSKEEVLAWRFGRLFEEFAVRLPDVPTLRELALAYFDFWRGHAVFLRVLTDNRLYGLLDESFGSFLPRIGGFAQAVEGLPHADYITAGVAGLLANLLLVWGARDFDLSPKELADLLVASLDGTYFDRG